MDSNFIHSLPHNPVKPVTMEHLGDDMVCIEDVKFPGDFFRKFAEVSDLNVVYRLERTADGKLVLHLVKTMRDAAMIFIPELVREFENDA